MQYLLFLCGIIISYCIGAIPTAYLFGKVLKGIDIRQFGSGNVGATNALRVLGKGPGVIVLCIDILKGFIVAVNIADFFSSRITIVPNTEVLRIILGLVSICGHNWTVFLNFKGGKGIATTLGVLLGLALRIQGLNSVLGLVILIWLIVFLLTRIISIASICAGLSLPVLLIFFKQSPILIVTGFILCAFVVIRHKTNIDRLRQGKEKRIF
ncbi:MAG: glycerol-3-phosphate 1-O-acyltransferase PlsY [Candidatus Omnitrophica bacterium]|nr:glycerol-3-phosphate 1-O-acyltransferase PlsY [Candidatus Omnitrophota bacterium]